MTDTERILEIIRDKGLSNVQFCNQTGISAPTLSHVMSGRSNPTLSILRQIVGGFPDLNPEWVYQGTGNMYKDLQIPEGNAVNDSQEQGASVPPYNNNEQDEPIFNFPKTDAAATGSMDLFGQRDAVANGSAAPRGTGASSPRSAQPFGKATMVTGAQLAEVVKETMSHYERPRRRIIEVRVFFDDGTYESFSGTN